MSGPQSLTIGLVLTAKGFGWIGFEGPFAPHDWGIVATRGDKNRACLARIEQLLERLQPEAVVMEALQQGAAKNSARIARLWRGTADLVANLGIELAVYSRANMQARFREAGASTRHEIAEAVARHVPVLRNLLPQKRKAWNSEPHNIPIFGAAALVATHYAYGAGQVFESLRDIG